MRTRHTWVGLNGAGVRDVESCENAGSCRRFDKAESSQYFDENCLKLAQIFLPAYAKQSATD